MRYVVGIAVSIATCWLVLMVALFVARPKDVPVRDIVRFTPDLVRLVRRLADEKTLSRRVRVRLWLLLAFIVSPIDVIPDFIPVIGFADDAILIYLVLRSVVRIAGDEVVARNWPGSEDGLVLLKRLLG